MKSTFNTQYFVIILCSFSSWQVIISTEQIQKIKQECEGLGMRWAWRSAPFEARTSSPSLALALSPRGRDGEDQEPFLVKNLTALMVYTRTHIF